MPFVSLLYLSRISFELKEPNFLFRLVIFYDVTGVQMRIKYKYMPRSLFFLLTPLKSVNCKDIYHVAYNFHE